MADSFGFIKIAPAFLGLFILWPLCAGSRFRKTWIDWPLAACAVAFLASLIGSVDPLVSILGVHAQPFHGAVALIPALLIFYAVASEGARWPDGALVAAGAVALIQGVVCAAQLGGLVPYPFDTIGGRALGTMGSPVFLGGLLAPCVPAAVWLAARGGAFGWAAAIGAFLAITAIWSRGPWISVLVGLWGYLVSSGRIRLHRWHFAALGVILAMMAALSVTMGKAESDHGRAETWLEAARAGAFHPVLGWGPDTFPIALRQIRRQGATNQASAHNDLLQVWATTGIVGLSAYIWLWAALLLGAWRAARWDLSGRSAAIFGSLLALFVAAKFNPIPPSAIYIAAALAGSALSIFPRPPFKNQRIPRGLGLLFLIGSATLTALKLTGENLNSLGISAIKSRDINRGADLLRRANTVFPSEIAYAAQRCELIIRISPAFPIDRQKDFARRMLRSASNVVGYHPQDSSSYELMSSVELWSSSILGGYLARAAMRSASRALDLDPFSEFAAMRLRQSSDVWERRHPGK